MNHITVKVSRENIHKGVPGQVGLCPIARALKDMGFNNVRVVKTYVLLATQKGKYYHGTLPLRARDFIIAYDTPYAMLSPRDKVLVPFKFNMPIKHFVA